MCVTAQAILDRLLALFPDFGPFWGCEHNYFCDEGGSFTLCGVFSHFSLYFCARYEQLPRSRAADFGPFVTEWMAADDADLRDAVASCFLENVAGERFSSCFRRFLSGDALRAYSEWDG